MPARRSTAIVQPSSLLKALIQSCRFMRTRTWRASRYSASFSAAPCMYPITGSALVITPPPSARLPPGAEGLARVAIFGQLLGGAMHVPDHGLGLRDHLTVELQDHPKDPMGRRML